jgi:hypothetical protein
MDMLWGNTKLYRGMPVTAKIDLEGSCTPLFTAWAERPDQCIMGADRNPPRGEKLQAHLLGQKQLQEAEKHFDHLANVAWLIGWGVQYLVNPKIQLRGAQYCVLTDRACGAEKNGADQAAPG